MVTGYYFACATIFTSKNSDAMVTGYYSACATILSSRQNNSDAIYLSPRLFPALFPVIYYVLTLRYMYRLLYTKNLIFLFDMLIEKFVILIEFLASQVG